MKVALDFAPGLHGHFLEYVVNKYIYNLPIDIKNIFQSSGAAHVINVDSEYQRLKMVDNGHYTAFDYEYPLDTCQVIFIKHNFCYDFVLLTNIYYRCHPDAVNATDFNVDQIQQLQENLMFSKKPTKLELRNNWYSKLNNQDYELCKKYPKTSLPVFDFNFASFFDFREFLLELTRLAKFLNQRIHYSVDLFHLWQQFIDQNQGYKLYSHAQEILKYIFAEEKYPIDDDWKLHAYINYVLSLTFDIWDGLLFEADQYPTDTAEISFLLLEHTNNFDQRVKDW